MFTSIAKFEFLYQIRQPVFYVTSLVFFLLTFGATTVDSIQIGGGGGSTLINSPYAIIQTLMVMSVFSIFITTAFSANPVLRDRDMKMDGILFSAPIRKGDYLFGRFSGAFAVAFIAFSASALGILLGSWMPWLDAERLGPTHIAYYTQALFLLTLPSLLFCAALFFSLAALTRSMMATYTGLIAFLVLYFTSQGMLDEPANRGIASLLDPFGYAAFENATRYWTAFERNTSMLPMEGEFLFNRLIWLGASAVFLLLSYRFFSFADRKPLWSRKKNAPVEEETGREVGPAQLPRLAPVFNAGTTWLQFRTRCAFEVKAVLKSLAFWVILALGMFNILGASLDLGALFGTSVYPVTRIMVDLIQGAFSLIMLIVLIYYGAELVWRERQSGCNEIMDAVPTPNWIFVLSKFVAMLVVLMGVLIASVATTVSVQLAKGYFNLEPGLYLYGVWYHVATPYYLMAVLSLFVQVLTRNKFLAMLIMVGYLISTMVLDGLGFEHNLYQFAGTGEAPYSDMNGYGHFEQGRAWLTFYWSCFSVVLAVLSYGLWQRGTLQSLGGRLRMLPHRLGAPSRVICGTALLLFLASGTFIFYNTNILNDYETSKDREEWAADYEKKYKSYAEAALPRITDVKADVDIFPDERRYEVRGSYRLENKTAEPIDEIMVGLDRGLTVNRLTLSGAELQETDQRFGYRFFDLSQPLAPGESLTLDFDLSRINRGFENAGSSTTLVANGAFFNNMEAFPYIGYNKGAELTDRHLRRKYDLPPPQRMHKLEDRSHHGDSYLRGDSDWVTFETTVSTSAGQTALAPGYLQKDWVDGNRHYFHYKMDAPIHNFFSYLSANYTVMRDQWRDVAIEVYHHKPHDYNVPRMVESVKRSLAYFSEAFSPYQYRQLRIVEFPGYQRFAQAFPNTVPYSEALGFIADLRDPEDIDYVFYVTAHEVAHQWWAHQLLGADVQGATMLSETLAQYSALMVMEREYGPRKIRKFLKYELDRYLSGRGEELLEELPLVRNEDQPYVHYRKGSVAMYALKDAMGEEAINGALAALLEESAYASDPYPTSMDLVAQLRERAGAEDQKLISDMLERIVLFDLKVEDASSEPLGDSRYRVALEVSAKKFRADGEGRETEIPLDNRLDIAVFSEDPDKAEGSGHVLYFAKHEFDENRTRLEFEVEGEPAMVGIDPYIKMIDKNPEDNLLALESD
ncbi:ABC transporter permease/M1 family aminopeptidase [Microbulbifer halophilus]|uniref:ABC transporter permease/M1 family aminopeptidase n=1 Tax=Microbulbifer halophilus TaxID=453963 RepID=A0ABW5E9X9_9GAMM|nr:ABC transporter permease subunit [Microbulbifer halophilus]MCW8125436.1 ABC transporter permease subunit [Microbulbifer halophilus]